MAKTPTIRSLARQLGLSVATVSEALRDNRRVKPETMARVRHAAEKVGYRHNPLLGAALSAVRRSAQQGYRGTLALVDHVENGRIELMLFHREILAGAKARAESLGFKIELFWLGEGHGALSPTRLDSVLQARGISGVVLLPFHTVQDMSDFDFSRFAAVQMDHCLIRPHLHTVVPDHYVSIMNALERLTALGYRRLGLCLDQRKDKQLKRKWSAGFQAFFSHNVQDTGIPVLIEPQVAKESFIPWYTHYRPELVVGHAQQLVAWLRDIGVRVPEDVGYFNLNITERIAPCAGLNLEPCRLGATAVETVVAMLHRQERGVPPYAQTITLEATWVDGPTLRQIEPSKKPVDRRRVSSGKSKLA